jgi:hypothetical protein
MTASAWDVDRERVAEIMRLRAALASIAEQPTSDELPEAEREHADFRGGYDYAVRRARETLQPK